jgi:hypothetical protein
MKVTRLLSGVLIATCVLSMSDQAAAGSQSSVVGDWYGQGEPFDKNMAYLDHFRADGTVVTEVEICKGKTAMHGKDSGTWTASKDAMRVVTTVSDGAATHFQTDYEIMSNDGKTWSYRIVAAEPEQPSILGYVFTAKRVSPDFRLPGCLQIS